MSRKRILFVCSQLGARARLAEWYVGRVAPGEFEVQSAGFRSGQFGPFMEKLTREAGIDIPLDSPPSVLEQYSVDNPHEFVVFICNNAMVDLCELFDLDIDKLFIRGETLVRWTVPAFNSLDGTEAERLGAARRILQGIERNVGELVRQIRAGDVDEFMAWEAR